MARTVNEIKNEMTTRFVSDVTIISKYGLTPGQTFEQQFSIVSLENILFSLISFVLFIHENIVETNALNSRPHTIRWYKDQALNFLYGLDLTWQDGQFNYDLTGVTDAEDRKIIDRCAVLESNDGELVIKVAKDNGGVIEPLGSDELLKFRAYMNLIKDAGNRLRIINDNADLLKLNLTVYVNPLIIDLDTGKLLTTDADVYPVKDAISSYLGNLEFNGAFVKSFLQDAIQQATGIELPIINSVEWKYAGFSFVAIGEVKIPEAGYFKVEESDLTITYLEYDLANI